MQTCTYGSVCISVHLLFGYHFVYARFLLQIGYPPLFLASAFYQKIDGLRGPALGRLRYLDRQNEGQVGGDNAGQFRAGDS